MRKIIALVVLRPQREYNLDIINRIRNEIYSKGYGLLVVGTFTDLFSKDKNDYGERSVLELIPYERLSGLIIMPGSFQDIAKAEMVISKAKARNIPVLSLDYDWKTLPSVNYDYKGGYRETVRHVVEFHKCRKVYMIAGMKDNPYSDERIEVFKEICRKNGISENDSKVFYGNFWGMGAKKCIDEIMTIEEPLPEAICVANDVMAVAAIERLEEYGVKVPEEMIVTGFDGIDIGIYNNPRMTTADTDSRLLCRKAALRMIEMIEGTESDEDERLMLIPLRLCVHASCGCKQDSETDISRRMLDLEEKYTKVQGNAGHLIRMRNKTLALNRPEIYRMLSSYISDNTWVVVNNSFWENLQTSEHDFDYEHDMDHFDENMTAVIYKPVSDGNTETRDVAGYKDKCEYEIAFNRNEIVPYFEEIFEERGVMTIMPLNFQDEVIGYYVFCDMSNENEILRDAQYSTQLCQNIGTVFRVVRDREVNERLLAALRSSYSALQEISIHDQLTGVINRRGLTQILDEMCEMPNAAEKILFYSYIDIDGFKMINDMWGHDEGDEALVNVAKILNEVTDKFSNCVAARIGGDEFVVAGTADFDISERFEEVLNDAVNRYNERSGKPYLIELSVGKVIRNGVSSETVRESIKDADTDMYRVKKNRKKIRLKEEL
ncbi:MAG: GGDEF domain-containing protein [Eubacterium sp.]|nr:GGDEF domain-containing protein [Eubacterium sp.]